MPCFVANFAVVSSPRSASSATFALKSAEYRFRLPVMQVRPSQERTELNLLSEFQGPPHRASGGCQMRSMLLAAFGAIAVAAIGPASATTGGIVITHCGGDANVATGRLSGQSDQSATTLGGVATGRGHVI